MGATVSIKYVGTFGADFDARKAMDIMSTFVPSGSYVDCPAYNAEYASIANEIVADSAEEGEKSIYSTNVYGRGFVKGDLKIVPMASASTPMALFELAKAEAFKAEQAGEDRPTIAVVLDDNHYQEELYFIQMKNNLAFQGGEQEYEITIEGGAISGLESDPTTDPGQE